MAGQPSWFEVGVGDVNRARTFYGELLGWDFEPGPSGGEPGGGTIRTSGIEGGIHGGDEGARPYLFFRVDDMDRALARVAELGGKVERLPGDPEQASEFGRFALCRDDQGSGFGLHQPPAG